MLLSLPSCCLCTSHLLHIPCFGLSECKAIGGYTVDLDSSVLRYVCSIWCQALLGGWEVPVQLGTLNRSKIWWRLRERHLWNVTLLPCKPGLSFNVLDGYVLKTWLLVIFRRKVRYFPFLFFPCTHLTNSRILRILKHPVLWLDLYLQQYSHCDFSKELPYQVSACGCRFLVGSWVWHPPDGCSRASPTPSGSTAGGLSPSQSRSHHPTRWVRSFLLKSSLCPYQCFSHTCTTQRYVLVHSDHRTYGA